VLGPVAAPKQLRLVAALPRTAIGKVRRDVLRGGAPTGG
jgi:acyl-coenzyme A synthetase/AMP-(fatty) acid ligase